MKALILAAGYGIRLRPYSEHTPKALFPVFKRPLLDIIIQGLIRAGCTGIIINTHHLHEKIASFINHQDYAIPVITRFEEKILGTGGAIKNVSDFFGNRPFVVINSDILTDIDVDTVYAYHRRHHLPVTLVMHDYPLYNNVWVDAEEYVSGFDALPGRNGLRLKRLAFTGIQVLDPEVIQFIPEDRSISSIDVYRHMLKTGRRIKAFVSTDHYWRDIGTPESYMEAVYEKTAPMAFTKGFNLLAESPIDRTPLAGDGSDRKWYRLMSGDHSLIMVDHGIKPHEAVSEIDAFVNIGRHLHQKGVPVPEIYLYDTFSGLVFLQDLGDANLQTTVINEKNKNRIIYYYKSVIDQMPGMWINGARSFDPAWAYQTPNYDKALILAAECRYFVDAFLNIYLGMGVSYKQLETEFSDLADRVVQFSVTGLIHRDLQSRNIMVKDKKVFLIDFQGARMGPIQYDLAALLTDPYVNLPKEMRRRLLDYSISQLRKRMGVEKKKILNGYRFCAIARTLQALGAFAYLSRVKHKPDFEKYIPVALKNLYARLTAPGTDRFPELTGVVAMALKEVATGFDRDGMDRL